MQANLENKIKDFFFFQKVSFHFFLSFFFFSYQDKKINPNSISEKAHDAMIPHSRLVAKCPISNRPVKKKKVCIFFVSLSMKKFHHAIFSNVLALEGLVKGLCSGILMISNMFPR